MKSVNPATQMLLDVFKHKSEENSGPEFNAGHPYFAAIEAANMINVPTDDDKFREATLNSLELWSGITIAKMIGEVLNEIATVGKIAMKASDKGEEAAKELLSSMGFIQALFQAWANSVDLEHIAEFVFKDGERRFAAAKAAGHPSAEFLPDNKTPEEALKEMQQRLEDAVASQKAKEPKPEPQSQKQKKDGPPVTPEDIMKMLFAKHTNPSVN